MKYIFYYGIKSIDESYTKEIIGPSSEDPKILEKLFEYYENFCKLVSKLGKNNNDNTNII